MPWRPCGAQVTHFEFSNECNKRTYNGCTTAEQYAAALLDWAPRLKAIKPDLLLGANGPGKLHQSSEAEEEGSHVRYWEVVRALRRASWQTAVM